eukprot:267792-Pelagomonas_calceolata.AAC.1
MRLFLKEVSLICYAVSLLKHDTKHSLRSPRRAWHTTAAHKQGFALINDKLQAVLQTISALRRACHTSAAHKQGFALINHMQQALLQTSSDKHNKQYCTQQAALHANPTRQSSITSNKQCCMLA